MKKTMIIVLGLAMTISLATAALAGWGNGQGVDRGGPLQKMTRHLDLTVEQEEDIRAIIEESRSRMQSLQEAQRDNREDFRQIKTTEDFDKGKALAIAREQAELKVEIIAERHATRQKVERILTPDQRERLDQYRDERHARLQDRKGPGKRFRAKE